MTNKPLKELLEFGILNIDKPSGPTSFGVSDFVRKKLNSLKISNEILAPRNLGLRLRSDNDKISLVRKTSHFGTLDPKVTGVLPIALNRACKLTGFFLGHDKEYIGIMRIHEDIEIKKIQEIINSKFLGKIKQTPPVKSRVKRQEREREIKNFELIEKEGKDILFKCEVQGGTYIRKLIDDLGKEIGGAHMLELRRTRAGIFSENSDKFMDLYKFSEGVDNWKNKKDETELKKFIIPAEEALKKVFRVVQVKESEVKKLWAGKQVLEKDLKEKSDIDEERIICVFSGEKFIGMYRVLRQGKIFAKPEFVLQPIKI